MTETDNINEEIRNYKLFKIQRMNAKEQQFSEFQKDLIHIRQNEIFNYLIASLNVIAVLFLVYNSIKSYSDHGYYEKTIELIWGNFITVILLSIFLTYKFILYNLKLKKHIKTVDGAVSYFAGESNILKSIYENYVENYLEESKKKR
ncbi:hypothetical protein [Chryseobacterium binzhouense]|uniref:hypothetical protein n=1 Tax=Chryseobacterium binzhouense TaxID=2593646 RepID=UPI001627C255|nr:hypothetical protein [Chryseobacterium binzhouense]